MEGDSLEELRQRLLRDSSVQEMIRARAYEIYLMRGVQPGGPAHDWFQAEGEVLAFLLANQPPEQQTEQTAQRVSSVSVEDSSSEGLTPTKKRKPRSTPIERGSKKTAARRSSTAKNPEQPESKPKRTRKKSKSEDETA
jgi:hypothetical protein